MVSLPILTYGPLLRRPRFIAPAVPQFGTWLLLDAQCLTTARLPLTNETPENREQFAKIVAALTPSNNTPPGQKSNLQPVRKPHLAIRSVVVTGGVYKGQGRNQRKLITNRKAGDEFDE